MEEGVEEVFEDEVEEDAESGLKNESNGSETSRRFRGVFDGSTFRFAFNAAPKFFANGFLKFTKHSRCENLRAGLSPIQPRLKRARSPPKHRRKNEFPLLSRSAGARMLPFHNRTEAAR
jgi:hypothetical protein